MANASAFDNDAVPLLLSLFGRAPFHDMIVEYLVVRDIWQLPLLNKKVRKCLEMIEYTRCMRDDNNYLLPFPGIFGLNLAASSATTTHVSSGNHRHSKGGLFPHQLASLTAMFQSENASKEFGALRGGILGDAPGLGKTITTLALICLTAGRKPKTPPEIWNPATLEDGWAALRINPEGKASILKCLKPVRELFLEDALLRPPYTEEKFTTLRQFERYVVKQLENRHPKFRFLIPLFRRNLMQLKAGLDPRNRKLIKSDMGRRVLYEWGLIGSGATLVIVPNALLEHWLEQMQRHLQTPHFLVGDAGSSAVPWGVVYVDGVGDLTKVTHGNASLRNNDASSQNLADAGQLSEYLVVITTFARCEEEFGKEVAANRLLANKKRKAEAVDAEFQSSCPLLQLRWLRLVVDEGHELGGGSSESAGVTRFIHQIAAERRWVLSGTPTTGDEDTANFSSTALDQLQRLLYFLRHPTYGNMPKGDTSISPYVEQTISLEDEREDRKRRAKTAWVTTVKRPFLARQQEGLDSLRRVLKETMVMHRKEDIWLPPPIFKQAEVDVRVPMEQEDKMEGLAGHRLLHSIDRYLHSVDFQVLVDQAQAEHISRRIDSAKEALKKRGGALPQVGMAVANRSGSRMDRRQIKAVVYSSENNNLLSVTEHLIRQLGMEHIAEMNNSDNIAGLSSELSRFRHGFREHKTCPICKQANSLGARGKGNRCDFQLMEVVSTNNNGDVIHRLLIEPERITRTLNVQPTRLDGEPLSKYPMSSKFWRVGDELEIDIRDPHPMFAKRNDMENWREWGVDKCISIAREEMFWGQTWFLGPLPVHDPFDYTIQVRLAKWSKCNAFHSSKWYKGPKLVDEPVERNKEDVVFLSLDASLSHGLDLSFVTHLFLLEPIDDAALLEQVTSRAHRLGATGSVTVETVHPFFKLSSQLQTRVLAAEADVAKASKASSQQVVSQNKEKVLTIQVCYYCYRHFDSKTAAEEHERTKCPRNPALLAVHSDEFQLSSVYREIRPPPAPTPVERME